MMDASLAALSVILKAVMKVASTDEYRVEKRADELDEWKVVPMAMKTVVCSAETRVF